MKQKHVTNKLVDNFTFEHEYFVRFKLVNSFSCYSKVIEASTAKKYVLGFELLQDGIHSVRDRTNLKYNSCREFHCSLAVVCQNQNLTNGSDVEKNGRYL